MLRLLRMLFGQALDTVPARKPLVAIVGATGTGKS